MDKVSGFFWTRFGKILDALFSDSLDKLWAFSWTPFGRILDAPLDDLAPHQAQLLNCRWTYLRVSPTAPIELRRRPLAPCAAGPIILTQSQFGQSRPGGVWVRLHHGALLMQHRFEFLRRPRESGQATLVTQTSGFEFCIFKNGLGLAC